MYSLHIETWTWKEHTPDVSGDAPPPLFGATAAVLLDGRNLLLFGGTGGEGGAPPSSVITVLDTCEWLYSTPTILVSCLLRAQFSTIDLGNAFFYCQHMKP